jgi:hypothetical protein
LYTAKNLTIKKLCEQAGLEFTEEIEFFAELIAEECADIADSARSVNLPSGPIIRRHFSLLPPK